MTAEGSATRAPARPVSAPSWRTDLGVGLRLIRAGGRATAGRMVLTGLGIALCVLVILLLAGILHASVARDSRAAAATPDPGPTYLIVRPVPTFRYADAGTFVGDTPISGYDLTSLGGAAPPAPPGVARFPAPGELFVSPALQRLLASDAGAALRNLLTGLEVGTIDPGALVSPDDLVFYRGVSTLPSRETSSQSGDAYQWGGSRPQELSDATRTLLVTGGAVVIIPLLLFVALAGRLGGTARDHRAAAIRLLGASSGQLRRLTAIEVLVAAVAGTAVGIGVFALLRLAAPAFSYSGHRFVTADVVAPAWLLVTMVVAIPALAVMAGLIGSRGTADTPIGVVRQQHPRPKVWWRLSLLVLAVSTIALPFQLNGPIPMTVLSLLLVPPVLLPWLLDLVARRVSGGGPATRLALGRIIQDPVGAARMVAGVAVVLAGAIALTAMLSVRYTEGDAYSRASMVGSSPADVDRAVRAVAAVPGVTDVRGTASAVGSSGLISISTCSALTAPDYGAPLVTTCTDGDAFVVAGRTGSTWIPGETAALGGSLRWTVPAGLPRIAAPYPPDSDQVVLTPSAAAQLSGPGDWQIDLKATIPPGMVEQTRGALAVLGIGQLRNFEPSRTATQLVDGTPVLARNGLILGIGLALAVCVLGQLALAIQHATDRRRSWATAIAAGVRPSVLTRSALIGAAIPALIGGACGTAVGFGLAWQFVLGSRPAPILSTAAWMGGAAVGVVVLFSLLTIPLVHRFVRVEGLQTE